MSVVPNSWGGQEVKINIFPSWKQGPNDGQCLQCGHVYKRFGDVSLDTRKVNYSTYSYQTSRQVWDGDLGKIFGKKKTVYENHTGYNRDHKVQTVSGLILRKCTQCSKLHPNDVQTIVQSSNSLAATCSLVLPVGDVSTMLNHLGPQHKSAVIAANTFPALTCSFNELKADSKFGVPHA